MKPKYPDLCISKYGNEIAITYDCNRCQYIDYNTKPPGPDDRCMFVSESGFWCRNGLAQRAALISIIEIIKDRIEPI